MALVELNPSLVKRQCLAEQSVIDVLRPALAGVSEKALVRDLRPLSYRSRKAKKLNELEIRLGIDRWHMAIGRLDRQQKKAFSRVFAGVLRRNSDLRMMTLAQLRSIPSEELGGLKGTAETGLHFLCEIGLFGKPHPVGENH